MDLHTPDQQPPEANAEGSPPDTDPSSGLTAVNNTSLNLSLNVKRHLLSIYFEHLQPTFPVVSRASLQHFPPTPLLEATILGTACCHHEAIASWRDLKHIQEIIASELRSTVSFGRQYRPSVQTLQALLLLSLQLELTTHGHHDGMSISLRLGVLCQMASDLGIERQDSVLDEDKVFFAILWKACLFQDAFLCATFGQPLNIPVAPVVSLELFLGSTLNSDEEYFFTAVEASHCLRHILRAVYASKVTSEDDAITRSHQALAEMRLFERILEARRTAYTVLQYRSLCMFHHNNRLLFVLGLATLIKGFHQKAQIMNLMSQEASFLIPEACQTLVWFDVEFLRSKPCRLGHLLYCGSRAAMLIVDVLLEARRTQGLTTDAVQNLNLAIDAGRTLKNHLVGEAAWSIHWSQGHTLEAILARLDNTTDQARPPMAPELREHIGLQGHDAAAATYTIPQHGEAPEIYDFSNDESLLNNVLFNSQDWDSILVGFMDGYP